MKKVEFLNALQQQFSILPQNEAEERLLFYSEMIEDQMEEGRSEEDAVSAVGSVDEIVAQAVAEIPLSKIAKERIKAKRRMHPWELLLLFLGSPIWLSLGIALFAVLLSLYLSLWAIVIALWSVFVSLIACAFAGVIVGVILAGFGRLPVGFGLIGAGLICAGFGIVLFFVCKPATQGTALLAKKTGLWIKKCLMKKEDAS